MSQNNNPRSSEAQQAWTEAFNCGVELSAKRLEQANAETKAVDAVRGLMLVDGPQREKIDAMLGISGKAPTTPRR